MRSTGTKITYGAGRISLVAKESAWERRSTARCIGTHMIGRRPLHGAFIGTNITTDATRSCDTALVGCQTGIAPTSGYSRIARIDCRAASDQGLRKSRAAIIL